MAAEVIYLPAALADIESTIDWYEAESPGLGAAFVFEMKAAEQLIADAPLALRPLGAGFRRKLLRRFPYHVYYKFGNDVVLIEAVIHAHRDPAYPKARLGLRA